MTDRRLLLMAPARDDMMVIGRALRDSGYLVFPARHHELPVDAIVRVRPDLVLIDADSFDAVQSSECRDAVVKLGSQVLLFTRNDSTGDAAALQTVLGLPYPMVEYSGDARAMAGLLQDHQRSNRTG